MDESKRRQITALMGIPAAGKTTLCQSMVNLHFISPDDNRKRLTGSKSDQSRNEEAFDLAHEELRAALKNGEDVLFDSTALTQYARHFILEIAAELDVETRLIILRTPFEECLARNNARVRDRVPEHVMYLMHERFWCSLSQVAFEPWDQIVNCWGDWK